MQHLGNVLDVLDAKMGNLSKGLPDMLYEVNAVVEPEALYLSAQVTE